MPRYYFHRTNGDVENDDDGIVLEDLDTVKREAIRFAGQSLNLHPELVLSGREFRVEVTDENGQVVFTVLTSGTSRFPHVAKS